MSGRLDNRALLLQNLMENMTDHIYFKDVRSRFLMVNKAFCQWVGLSPQQVIGRTDFDLFASAHAQQAFEDEQRIIETGEPLVGVEEKETWPDGRITWVSTTKMPLEKDGKIVGTFGVSRDITDHKETDFKAVYYAEQIRRIKESIEDDVRMAAELQKTFFPHAYPTYPADAPAEQSCVEFAHHYHASGMVSGDFCSIRRLSETESAVFICDVMGHGVRAALGMALICAMIDEASPAARHPGQFLRQLNDQLFPILRQEDVFLFATAFYMVFDARTGELRVANAGHPVPLHLQAEKKRADWLVDESLRGPALAIVEGIEFPAVEKQLQPGDSVVAYTDGLFEVEGNGGEEFGTHRLLAAAQSFVGQALNDQFMGLLGEAMLFSGNSELDDDVCLAGLRFRRPMSRRNSDG